MQRIKVYFEPAKKLVEAEPGENLLQLAQRNGIHIDSTCGGNGSCHLCRVTLTDGARSRRIPEASTGGFTALDGGPAEVFQQRDDGTLYYLACRGCVTGSLHVAVSPRTDLADSAARQSLIGRAVSVDQPRSAQASFAAAITVMSGGVYGYLASLSDGVISADAFSLINRWDGHTTVNDIHAAIAAVLAELGTTVNAEILHVTLCGSDPSLLHGLNIQALGLSDDTSVTIMPFGERNMMIAAILGANLPVRKSPHALFSLRGEGMVIVGTSKDFIAGLAPDAGAFDGVGITHGMPGAPGAMDSLQIVPSQARMIVTTVGEESLQGIAAGGMLDCVHQFVMAGLSSLDGRFKETRTMRVRDDGVKEAVIAAPHAPALTPAGIILEPEAPVAFSERDFGQVLEAKGSMAATLELIVRESGEKPQSLVIDCAGGAGINPETLFALGLSGGLPPDAIDVAGDLVGLGTMMFACSLGSQKQANDIARQLRVINVATKPDYPALAAAHRKLV